MSMDSVVIKKVFGPTEAEQATMDMVLRYLREARERKATGKLTFEIEVHEGGITGKWASPRYREK